MKHFYFLLFCLTPLILLGQDTNAVPIGDGEPVAHGLNLLNLLITGLTPIIIYGVKAVVPKIPKFLLPVAAPLVGIAVDFVLRKVGLETSGSFQAALWGAAGVWLREVQDQAKQAMVAAPDKP